jgi:hypothetical protein
LVRASVEMGAKAQLHSPQIPESFSAHCESRPLRDAHGADHAIVELAEIVEGSGSLEEMEVGLLVPNRIGDATGIQWAAGRRGGHGVVLTALVLPQNLRPDRNLDVLGREEEVLILLDHGNHVEGDDRGAIDRPRDRGTDQDLGDLSLGASKYRGGNGHECSERDDDKPCHGSLL